LLGNLLHKSKKCAYIVSYLVLWFPLFISCGYQCVSIITVVTREC